MLFLKTVLAEKNIDEIKAHFSALIESTLS